MNTRAPQTLADGSLMDCATALSVSFDRLAVAAQNAQELLQFAGLACTKGDTADDLANAVAIHSHLLHQFDVKIRTNAGADVCTVTARTCQDAYAVAAERQGDEPFGISVRRAEPDMAALEAAQLKLGIKGPLIAALSHPTLGVAIRTVARKPPKPQRTKPHRIDFKSLAANDRD